MFMAPFLDFGMERGIFNKIVKKWYKVSTFFSRHQMDSFSSLAQQIDSWFHNFNINFPRVEKRPLVEWAIFWKDNELTKRTDLEVVGRWDIENIWTTFLQG